MFPTVFAGLLLGLIVGGVGGRIAMFVLRVTSGSDVVGLESDDGFTIGRFSLNTLFLLAATTAIGGVGVGPFYALVRPWVPAGWRTIAPGLFFGVVGGAVLVRSDGVDFTVLTPVELAIVLFVALPLLFGLLLEPTARVGERLSPHLPRWVFYLVPFMLLPTGPPGIVFALLVLVLIGGGWLDGAREVLRSRVIAWTARVLLIGLMVLSLNDLVGDIRTLV